MRTGKVMLPLRARTRETRAGPAGRGGVCAHSRVRECALRASASLHAVFGRACVRACCVNASVLREPLELLQDPREPGRLTLPSSLSFSLSLAVSL